MDVDHYRSLSSNKAICVKVEPLSHSLSHLSQHDGTYDRAWVRLMKHDCAFVLPRGFSPLERDCGASTLSDREASIGYRGNEVVSLDSLVAHKRIEHALKKRQRGLVHRYGGSAALRRLVDECPVFFHTLLDFDDLWTGLNLLSRQ